MPTPSFSNTTTKSQTKVSPQSPSLFAKTQYVGRNIGDVVPAETVIRHPGMGCVEESAQTHGRCAAHIRDGYKGGRRRVATRLSPIRAHFMTARAPGFGDGFSRRNVLRQCAKRPER